MIGERGDEDAEHDGHGLAEARGQQQREQLGLVADLGERDHACRNEQGFQSERSVPQAVARRRWRSGFMLRYETKYCSRGS